VLVDHAVWAVFKGGLDGSTELELAKQRAEKAGHDYKEYKESKGYRITLSFQYTSKPPKKPRLD
jgi:hypothetical protein